MDLEKVYEMEEKSFKKWWGTIKQGFTFVMVIILLFAVIPNLYDTLFSQASELKEVAEYSVYSALKDEEGFDLEYPEIIKYDFNDIGPAHVAKITDNKSGYHILIRKEDEKIYKLFIMANETEGVEFGPMTKERIKDFSVNLLYDQIVGLQFMKLFQ